MAITQLLLAARARLADFTLTEGTVSELSVNESGRLRVSTKAGKFPVLTANLAAVNDVLNVDVTDASLVQITCKNTGTATMIGGTFVFEASLDTTNGIDGTWFPVQGVRSNANTADTNVGWSNLGVGANAGWSWRFNVNGLRWFRIRCTTAVTASTIATWTATQAAFASDPAPSIPTHAVTTTPGAASSYALAAGAASTNATVIKTSFGYLYELSAFNPTAATVYLKLYNLAAAPTVGTSVPMHTIPIPTGGSIEREFGALGKRFSTGIAYAITAAAADTDATAVAAGVKLSATYI